MTAWLKLLLATAAFWTVWLGVVGLAMLVHGDCGAGATDSESVAACVREKGWVGVIALVIGAILYAILVRAIVKRSR